MRGLVSLCVRHFGAVTAISVLALILGLWATVNAPLDVFPEFVPSQVEIQTEAPGFAPQQVEELVTRRVESAVNGAAGLATLRSESIPGLSAVTVTFDDRIDVHLARQGVSERLAQLSGTLPAGVGAPRLSPLVSSTMDLLKIGLQSDRLDEYALRDIADWVIKPRLLAVPGVAHAIVFGGKVRQIEIAPDPEKLTSFGVTMTELADAARAALALRGAGFIDLAAQRVQLTSPTPAPDLEAIGSAVVTLRAGVPILLRDLAAITQAPALRSGDALIMGKPGIMMSLASQYGANTLVTTRDVEKVLVNLKPALEAEGVRIYPGLHRPANFIERALADLERSLSIAAFLILVVLFVFLRDWRAALIAFTAIPLSLLAAIAALDHLGYTLNTMTLGGFAVALGVLVDDAIIDLENILRRLGTNAAAARPLPRLTVIRDASLEVRGPVIFATLVVITVFVPQLFASNVQGHFIGPLALAFILAVLASLLVAMTVTPALCALLLRRRNRHGDTAWLRRLKTAQAGTVRFVTRHFSAVCVALLAAAAAAAAAIPFLGGVFMPEFREGHFVLQVSSSIPGTSIEEMLALGTRISSEVLKLPYVKTIEQQVGRAELGEDTWGPHQSEFHVELKPDVQVDQGIAQQDLRSILDRFPGIQSEVVTFLGDRISESLTGDTAQVVVKVFGEDLDILEGIGAHIVDTIGSVPGVVDLQFKRESGTPTIDIRILPAVAAATGLTNQQILDTVEAAYAGTTVGQTFSGTRTIDTVLRLPDHLRHRPEELADLMIGGPVGAVPLGRLATLAVASDRYRIRHDGGQRQIAVTFNVDKRGVEQTVDDARERLSKSIVLPAGYFIEFAGAAAAARATQHELGLYAVVALAVVMMVLFVAFKWRANSWLVLANLPFSLVGGVAAIAATGIGISLGSVVGLVTVFGISARNAILQLSHYEHLVAVEGSPWDEQTVIRGANERFIPILMTAAVTALGLAPLALSAGAPGQEIEGPMAITVLGGLVSSTLLNLLVLPALSQRFARPAPPDETLGEPGHGA
jgi:CzcA family heavy metal efflux pump